MDIRGGKYAYTRIHGFEKLLSALTKWERSDMKFEISMEYAKIRHESVTEHHKTASLRLDIESWYTGLDLLKHPVSRSFVN